MPAPVLYTIGSSDRSPPEFIELLKRNGITLVVDIRSKTGSRVPHFDESRFGNLSRLLWENGIEYDASLHEVLGGLQNGKMTLGNFRKYRETAAYVGGIQALKGIIRNNQGGVAILCCEREAKKCHRSLIGETLRFEGWKVIHL